MHAWLFSGDDGMTELSVRKNNGNNPGEHTRERWCWAAGKHGPFQMVDSPAIVRGKAPRGSWQAYAEAMGAKL
jgi:hypothetical protein